MTQQEILQKAIEKAIKNGFRLGARQGYSVITKDGKFKTFFIRSSKFLTIAPPYYLMIIFGHDFSKAFWGEIKTCIFDGCNFIAKKSFDGEITEHTAVCENCGIEQLDFIEFPENGTSLPEYLYHLREMVVWDNPINYLEKFL